MRPPICLGLSMIFAVNFAGCGTGNSGGGGSPTNPTGLRSISVTPANQSITLGDTPQSMTFVATGTYQDGSSRDVTATAGFTMSPWTAGSFNGAVFTTTGIGAMATVIASIGSVSGQTTLTIAVDRKTVATGAPANAPDLFGGTADATRNPTVGTPFADTLLPPNLGMFEFAWADTSTNDLWELSVSCENFVLKTYLTTRVYIMTGTDATSFAESCRGKNAQVKVRGIKQGTTSGVGASEPVSFAFAEQNVEGGIYYWSNACNATDDSAIYRFDFGAPKQAEAYYGPKSRNSSVLHDSGSCVGCHSVSRDGKSITVRVGPDFSNELRVLSAKTLVQNFTAPSLTSAFTVFSPDGETFINGDLGVLILYNAMTGSTVGANSGRLPLTSAAAQPDWSADGSMVVAVLRGAGNTYTGPSSDVCATEGSITVVPYDRTTGSFGEPNTIVPSDGTTNNYYPCFTPDNKHIIYNFAPNGNSYNNPNAGLMLVPVEGGDPIALTKSQPANHTRHSWPRVNPFPMSEKNDSLFWFTFSSTAVGTSQPQIFMAAIRLPSSGVPVQYASFRLPYQASTRCNHIAQWTQEIAY